MNEATSTDTIKTPLYDALRPRYQMFIDGYLLRYNVGEGAKQAGYKGESKELAERGREIFIRDEIQAALVEVTNVRKAELENSKTAIIERLKLQAMVSLGDLCKWDLNTKGWVIKPPHEVDKVYLPVMGMVSTSREKAIVFNQGAQDKARQTLQAYMLWDKQSRDDLPAVTFDFGGIKRETYSKDKA